jgi:hypothetical protein
MGGRGTKSHSALVLVFIVRRYSRISGIMLPIVAEQAQPQDVTVCNSLDLNPADQIPILEGDVYAVNMVSRNTGLPVLAALPPGLERRLFRDSRDFSDVTSSRELRQNQLQGVDDIGMHLFADIRE